MRPGDRCIAIDLNLAHIISFFGAKGGGRSYALGTITEMASLPIPSINVLPQSFATVIFHYSPTMGLPAGVHVDGRPDQRGRAGDGDEVGRAEPMAEYWELMAHQPTLTQVNVARPGVSRAWVYRELAIAAEDYASPAR